MKKIVFRIQRAPGGWVIRDSSTIGPFISKDQALELARGMVAILRQHGEDADYADEDPDSDPQSS